MRPTVRLPLLPLRDIVVFPSTTVPLLAGRAKSLIACAQALGRDGRILLVAQRDPAVEEPSLGDLHRIGVIASLVRHLSLPEERMKLLARGERRARLVSIADDATAVAEPLDEAADPPACAEAPESTLLDWRIDSQAAPRDRVAELQRILEDNALSPAGRVSAAAGLMRGG